MNPCEPGKRTHKQRGNPEKKVIQMNHSSIQGNGICVSGNEKGRRSDYNSGR